MTRLREEAMVLSVAKRELDEASERVNLFLENRPRRGAGEGSDRRCEVGRIGGADDQTRAGGCRS